MKINESDSMNQMWFCFESHCQNYFLHVNCTFCRSAIIIVTVQANGQVETWLLNSSQSNQCAFICNNFVSKSCTEIFAKKENFKSCGFFL